MRGASRGLFRPAIESQYVHKTALQAVTDGVNLVDATEMGFTVEAGGVYIIEYTIFQLAAATTTGLVLSVNGPASPTYLACNMQAATSGTAVFFGAIASYDTAMASTGVQSTTIPNWSRLGAYLVNGVNAGTFALRMRSEVDTASATMSRGSWGRMTRVG